MSAAPKIKMPLLHGTDMSATDVLNSHLCDGYAHICQTNGHEYRKEVANSERLMRKPKLFFADTISTVLDKPEVLYTSSFHSSKQKDGIFNSFQDVLTSTRIVPTFVDEIRLVADELFTNAIYNAPATDLKTNVNAGVDRSSNEVAMHKGKKGQLTLAQDESRIAVSCFDPYGSLNLTSYLQRILSSYEVGTDYAMNFGAGGAGIGSFLIFNSGCSLYYGVAPGRATIVCCVFPLKKSGKQRQSLPKHLHCIQL